MEAHLTKSAQQTRQLAQMLARKIPSRVIALVGDLGAGKTTFVQGFAQGLGIKEKVISPTFVLVRIHQIPKSKKSLFHLDLYRLEKDQLPQIGLEEILADPSNLVLIEWAEKIKDLLPKDTQWIKFKIIDQQTRKISISLAIF